MYLKKKFTEISSLIEILYVTGVIRGGCMMRRIKSLLRSTAEEPQTCSSQIAIRQKMKASVKETGLLEEYWCSNIHFKKVISLFFMIFVLQITFFYLGVPRVGGQGSSVVPVVGNRLQEIQFKQSWPQSCLRNLS